jgi:hypothetical protein
MIAKLLTVILVAFLTAASLLVMRQHRLDAEHEILRTRQKADEARQALWELRNRIAHECRPEAIRRMMRELPEQWRSIPDPDAIEARRVPDIPAIVQSEPGAEIGG